MRETDKNEGLRLRRVLAAFLMLLAGIAGLSSCQMFRGNPAPAKGVIVLGIDGMDPQLLERYVAEGKLPHFAALAREGSFRRLKTSIPPQSPVAWSNLITGMNPGGHGIFDFIHRDPATLVPYLSTSKVEPSKHNLRLGSWVIPLSSGEAHLLRQGQAFWQILDEHAIPAIVFRMPANFPPVKTKSRTFAGMGTPDLLGTYGTFSFYTDEPREDTGPVEGGRILPVQVEGNRVSSKLLGPYNSFRKGEPQATVDFTVWLDPVEPVAKIVVQDHEILLREGEWSDWVRLEFELLPHLKSVRGIAKFFLKQVRPWFQLYVTPVNLDPSEPALPLSTPPDYARDLWQHIGFFYTQGIAEDTKALQDGVLSDADYLTQARMVLAEQLKIFDLELRRWNRRGLFFFYFSSLDQNAHMMWRAIDERHPAYTPELGAKYGHVLEQLYEEMDRALGQAMAALGEHTTLLVLSDHGFAPFERSFNLNTWLLENGYIYLKPGTMREDVQFLANVDWPRTRAYGLGLNGLYLNLRGREREGTVAPGQEEATLLDELTDKLLAIRDPQTNVPVITRLDRASAIYSGPNVRNAPDLIVGYNRGYRAGWGTVLGAFPPLVLEDNREPWSGDHCIDADLVPGVLLSNRKIAVESPALTDIAPTILAEFGVPAPKAMQGRSVFGPPASAER